MLVTRSYRNNIGYQIDVNRPSPLWAWSLERHNKNYYSNDGYTSTISYNPGGEKGLQYGGGCNNNQKGHGIDPEAVVKALKLLYAGAKMAPKIYSSNIATKIKNKYGEFMNNNPNWRPGSSGPYSLY